MRFSVLEYLDDLTRSLEELPVRKRLAFAAWCCEPLLQGGQRAIEEKLGLSLAERIRGALNAVWAAVVSVRVVAAGEFVDLRAVLERADWSDDDADTESVRQEEAALSCLECMVRVCDVVETSSSRSAAEAAERVINFLDVLLGQSPRVFENPIMKAEIEAQRKMIRWLGASEEIPLSARTAFRESSLRT